MYCCVNGSSSSNYGSEWYAFSAGNVRFYILDSAWGDTNGGTATPYANDALAHFAPGTPEYSWLINDLNTHPTQLKFAFSHYPFYSDNPSQPGDTYLQGANNLEGILGQHGVQLAFNGHAHIYERNQASAPGMPITYVTGGGGGTLEPIGPCHSYDLYGIGWSPTKLRGTACGSARAPTSASQVFHFLKVTVSGTTVTVTPTDSTGRTFDVQTYHFNVPTDTYIDSAPPAGTTSTSATFSFHASGTQATFSCRLDGGSATSCTSPRTYTGLGQGVHTFTVAATVNQSTDPTPATVTWTVDSTSPGAPGGFTASASSSFSVGLGWTAATDNTGVTGYDIFRDGSLLVTVPAVTTYTDVTVGGGSTHSYAVRARDVAGNVSGFTPTIPVTTPVAPPPVFADGFETGDLSAWTTKGGPLAVEGVTVHGGTHAAEANTTAVGGYAKKTLPSTYVDGYARTWFDVVAQTGQVNLLRLRDAGDASIGYAYIGTTGQLGYHNDATGTNTLSATIPTPGWHALELHVLTGGAGGAVELWLDGVRIDDLSGPVTTGANAIGKIQIGETQTSSQTYDVAFDDVAFGTARLGTSADSAPTMPVITFANATSAFSVSLTWSASTDDLGVAGYDILRDGTLVASIGNVTSYTDSTVLASTTYSYQVRARDTSGNFSSPSDPLAVTTPAPPAPLFADGFESGSVSWTKQVSLGTEGSTVHTGLFAAEGNTLGSSAGIYAFQTLPSTYNDAYARVAVDVVSLPSSQATLLMLRSTAGGTAQGAAIGHVYVTSAGNLYFKADSPLVAGVPLNGTLGLGWHVIELHLRISGVSSVAEVWLDGVLQTGIPALVNLDTDVGQIQIGETSSILGDLIFDDAAFGTARLGPVAYTAPTAPGAPTNVTAVAGDGSVMVSWSPPAGDGGSPITGYTVTGLPSGSAIVAGSSTSATVNNLTNGTSYTFTVTATNAVGTGPASPPSSAVSPGAAVTAPGAPTNVTAVAGDGSATVSWTAPASNGGSPITGYTITGSPDGSAATNGSASSVIVTGLTNGSGYTFTVTATNAVGPGPASSPSSSVTPGAAATAPGAPTNVTAVAGDGSATVSWTAPASNGGSPITGYAVTGVPGGSASTDGSTTSVTVSGLANGTSYTFTVTATNAVGTGPASSPSSAVTPGAAAGPLTFVPTADAYVASGSAKNANFGTASTLQVGSGLHSYLMFDVEGLTGSFTTATLRLWTVTAGSGATAHDVSSVWTETGITWNNAPAYGGSSATISNFAAGTWISYNVTSFVSGNGVVAFEYTSASSAPISFASREDATHAPQLVITP